MLVSGKQYKVKETATRDYTNDGSILVKGKAFTTTDSSVVGYSLKTGYERGDIIPFESDVVAVAVAAPVKIKAPVADVSVPAPVPAPVEASVEAAVEAPVESLPAVEPVVKAVEKLTPKKKK